MAAYRRVYDSRHLQADCQEPGSAPEPYARVIEYGLALHLLYTTVRHLSGAAVVDGGDDDRCFGAHSESELFARLTPNQRHRARRRPVVASREYRQTALHADAHTLAPTPPGMPGTHPPIFWLGDVNGNIPPNIIT